MIRMSLFCPVSDYINEFKCRTLHINVAHSTKSASNIVARRYENGNTNRITYRLTSFYWYVYLNKGSEYFFTHYVFYLFTLFNVLDSLYVTLTTLCQIKQADFLISNSTTADAFKQRLHSLLAFSFLMWLCMLFCPPAFFRPVGRTCRIKPAGKAVNSCNRLFVSAPS